VGFNRGHFFSALIGGLVAVIVMAALPAGAGNGDNLVMGRRNFALKPTKLTAKGGLVLKSGKVGRPPLTLEAQPGTPPMLVNSTTLVDNFNADLLDGIDSTAFAGAGHEHDTDYLGVGAKAADSELLDGTDAGEFMATISYDLDGNYLVDLAEDSQDARLLDGLDSSAFLGAADQAVDSASLGGDPAFWFFGWGSAVQPDLHPRVGNTCLLRGGFLLGFKGNGAMLCSKPSGTATFTDSGHALGNKSSRSVALGDLDGDGDLDAYTANTSPSGSPNRVWDNDGTGIFTDSGQTLGTNTTAWVALGDLDRDGDLDAYTANWNGQANLVWDNG